MVLRSKVNLFNTIGIDLCLGKNSKDFNGPQDTFLQENGVMLIRLIHILSLSLVLTS